MYYINSFFIYSILGFLMESTVFKVMGSHNHSGIFYGPITMVYGLGALFILCIDRFLLQKLRNHKTLQILLSFLIFTVLLTLLEWLGGVLIYAIFQEDLWDYSGQFGCFGKYISIPMALLWGIFSVLFIYIIKPIMEKIIKRVPKLLTYFMILAFLVDIIMTLATGSWTKKQ